MASRQKFLVHIIDDQNNTWQGNITWLGQGETEHFRSLLEMIKLIDTAVNFKGEWNNEEMGGK